ncbi:hypothetical protein DSECCO2_518940 [anaerobic digester metagenome]
MHFHQFRYHIVVSGGVTKIQMQTQQGVVWSIWRYFDHDGAEVVGRGFAEDVWVRDVALSDADPGVVTGNGSGDAGYGGATGIEQAKEDFQIFTSGGDAIAIAVGSSHSVVIHDDGSGHQSIHLHDLDIILQGFEIVLAYRQFGSPGSHGGWKDQYHVAFGVGVAAGEDCITQGEHHGGAFYGQAFTIGHRNVQQSKPQRDIGIGGHLEMAWNACVYFHGGITHQIAPVSKLLHVEGRRNTKDIIHIELSVQHRFAHGAHAVRVDTVKDAAVQHVVKCRMCGGCAHADGSHGSLGGCGGAIADHLLSFASTTGVVSCRAGDGDSVRQLIAVENGGFRGRREIDVAAITVYSDALVEGSMDGIYES